MHTANMSGTTFSTPFNTNNTGQGQNDKKHICSFQMPLHYPRYRKSDYEAMPEWKLDCLLSEYGLPVKGDLKFKREFAMGAFLWPSQNI